MKKHFLILLILTISILFTGCAKRYSYPNYEIIKPKQTCKPHRKNIQKLLNKFIGKPYIWAEEGPHAFDCSGLTYNIYGQMGVCIPRVARDQAKIGKKVEFEDLIYGDLIFFGSKNKKSRRINHVGIYLGNGWFAEASSQNRKVKYTSFINEPEYLEKIKVCRRYLSKSEKQIYKTCHGNIKPMRTTNLNHTTPWRPGNTIPRRAVPR